MPYEFHKAFFLHQNNTILKLFFSNFKNRPKIIQDLTFIFTIYYLLKKVSKYL